MKNQAEKNKELLLAEIEKYKDMPISDSVAELLNVYNGAYNALCMVENDREDKTKASAVKKTYRDEYINQTNVVPRKETSSDYSSASKSSEPVHLTSEMAHEWVNHMENADGTTGAHWPLDQTKRIQAEREIGGDPLKFWVAMNATYSDLCQFFVKHGISNMNAYVDYVLAFWLDDQDAVPNKLAAYYESVVEH